MMYYITSLPWRYTALLKSPQLATTHVKHKCRKPPSPHVTVPVPVRASVTPHKRRYTYYNKMFRPMCYELPQPLKVSLV